MRRAVSPPEDVGDRSVAGGSAEKSFDGEEEQKE
jgi:hypothetical protein